MIDCTLDAQLARDTYGVGKLSACDVRLMNDARYPWVVLVPRIARISELHELGGHDGELVWQEIRRVGKLLSGLPNVEKINVGALGNIVRQLHIHVVGRHSADPAWPAPVWGHSPPVSYEADAARAMVSFLQDNLFTD
jgi:diadenosine tetraphosphate (Ap4A) HIT family hydrolase